MPGCDGLKSALSTQSESGGTRPGSRTRRLTRHFRVFITSGRPKFRQTRGVCPRAAAGPPGRSRQYYRNGRRPCPSPLRSESGRCQPACLNRRVRATVRVSDAGPRRDGLTRKIHAGAQFESIHSVVSDSPGPALADSMRPSSVSDPGGDSDLAGPSGGPGPGPLAIAAMVTMNSVAAVCTAVIHLSLSSGRSGLRDRGVGVRLGPGPGRA